jgi:hypothetical protein
MHIRPDGRIIGRERIMLFDEIKTAITNLDERDQRRLVLEVLPAIWPNLVGDDACIKLIRNLVDEESVRRYQEEHMDHL